MDEEVNGDAMHEVRFREGGSLWCQAAHALAQSAIEAFEVVGWASLVALLKLLLGHDAGVGIPDVGTAASGKAASGFVSQRNAAPQHTARCFAATADGTRQPMARHSRWHATARASACSCDVSIAFKHCF